MPVHLHCSEQNGVIELVHTCWVHDRFYLHMASFMRHYKWRQEAFVTIQGTASGDGAHTSDRRKPWWRDGEVIKILIYGQQSIKLQPVIDRVVNRSWSPYHARKNLL